jgi:hypothetical protein
MPISETESAANTGASPPRQHKSRRTSLEVTTSDPSVTFLQNAHSSTMSKAIGEDNNMESIGDEILSVAPLVL